MSRSPSIPGVLAGAATAAGLIAHQVGGKAVRDALFLSTFPASSLPFAMVAGAVLSLVAVLSLSRLLARRSPATLMPIIFGASAAGLVLAWALGLLSPPLSAAAVYLHTTVFGAATISVFWSLVNERFDPHSAKRAVARIGAGGSLGGVLGALAAWRGASLVALPDLVLFLAGLHAACAGGALLLRTPRAPGSESPPAVTAAADVEPRSAFLLLRTTPILRQLGLLVVFGAATSALLDYVFSAQAAAAFGRGHRLLSFFALFWLAVSVVSFVLQATLGRFAIKRFALALNIAVLPGITILGGALGIAMPGLASTAILRGAEAAHRNTLFRSAYEVLYTPLTEDLKRTTKALIDVAFDRFGTVLGSCMVWLAVALVAERSGLVLLAAVVVLALVTLPVARRLHRSYVGALEQGLRQGPVGVDLPAIEQGSSRSPSELKERVQRDELIERVEALRPGGLAELSATEISAPGPAFEALRQPLPLIDAGRDLLSGDVARARSALAAWSGSTRPVAGLVILLLAHPQLHRDAVQALRRVAHLITGALVDALLDPAMDFVVRRRIPRVLGTCASQRAADGLLAGIHDERFEVRYECGRALSEITQKDPQIVVSRERVVAAILRETDKSATGCGSPLELEDDSAENDVDPLVRLLVGDRIDRSLEHVFTLLSLHLEREPLRMAFRALHQDDVRYRGTALEYLHTVIPPDIREAVRPLFGETGPLPEARPAHEILADLVLATSGDARGA